MSKVTFEFEETEDVCETTEIQLCANRWKLRSALYEVENLLRGLTNWKTCEEVCLYHKAYGKDEFNREVVTEYSRNGTNGDKHTDFVPLDFVTARLYNALEEVRHLLD